jgi:hypothetical protein
VHFVHNEGGANSMVQTLTIDEFRERRDQFLIGVAEPLTGELQVTTERTEADNATA